MPKFLLLLLASFVLFAAPAFAADEGPQDVAGVFFPVLPPDAPADAEPQLLPVAANHPLDGDHAGLTRAVIVIHDYSRDAQQELGLMSALAGGNNSSTIIVAPQFLIDFDVAHFAAHLPDQGKLFVRWPLDAWQDGSNSSAQPPQRPVSSFTALDLLLLYLGEKSYFPDLKQVTIAGHGAGGDFVQRYAAAGKAPDILAKQGVPVRFLVANAGSYLYFTAARPAGGKKGFTTPDASKCANYNDYKYGLDKLNDYARHTGANAIKLNYAARSVTYLISEKAVTGDPHPDTSCPAMLEGPDRGMRAMYYDTYLYQLFGEAAAKNQRFFTMPKVGYDAAALFGSTCGAAVLFGDGNCEPPPITGAGKTR